MTAEGKPHRSFIDALNAADREALTARAPRRLFKRGETVFRAGDPSETLLILESGRVEIAVTTPAGRRAILNYADPGDVLGELSLVDGQPRSADVKAVRDVSAVEIGRKAVLDFLRERPEAALAIIAEASERARNASQMLEMKTDMGVEVRLATSLLRIARRWGEEGDDGSITITQAFSQTEIGEFCGLTRESVNRFMKAWSQRGILDYDTRTRTIAIRKTRTLERLANDEPA